MKMYKQDLWSYLKEQSGLGRPVVLYGTGNGADKIIAQLERIGVSPSAVFASPGFVRNRDFRGLKVEGFEDCLARYGDSMIVLMCFGSSRPEVLSYVDELRGRCEFYAPDVPVYGNNLFDLDFYNAHVDELERVRTILADEQSVRTFDDIIAARITGDVKYLKDCEVTQEEADALVSDCRGLFVDLGAYNGDTVQRYAPMLPSSDGIIAVEPDSRNMRKLKENTSDFSSVEYVQAFVSDKEETVLTGRNLGRGTSAGKGSNIELDTVTINGITNGRPVGFIKFDVEGSELAALNGGAETIAAYKPYMNIACYHRSEDLFALPLKVLDINPDYKIYMRHTSSVPAWDTCFYVLPSV